MDGLIAALEKLIAKKQAIKQATMQQLLTGKTTPAGVHRYMERHDNRSRGRYPKWLDTQYASPTEWLYPVVYPHRYHWHPRQVSGTYCPQYH